MSLFDQAEVLVIGELGKGLDAYSQDTKVPPGYYPDADNVFLPSKTPETVGGLTRFSATAAPNSETILYAVPFSLVGATTEHLVYTSAGVWYRLLSDAYTQLRSGLSAAPTYLTHTPFRSRVVLANGVDTIQSWNGTVMIPVGSKLVSNIDTVSPAPGGTWDLNDGGDTATSETTTVREGPRAIRMAATAAGSPRVIARIAYTTTQDFTAGPQSGDTDFGVSDNFRCQINVVSGLANITDVRFRFYTTYAGVYKEGVLLGGSLAVGWNAVSIARSAFTDTGAPNFNSVTHFEVRFTVTGAATVIVDDCLFQYATIVPPIGNIVVVYNGYLNVGDQVDDRVRLSQSTVSQIDNFPTANFVRVTGGTYTLEVADRITAMRVYSSVIVVGKPRSIHVQSGTPTDLTVDVATTESGIDSHHSMVESPYALLYVYGNTVNGFRLTSREPLSTEINTLLSTLDLANAQSHVAVRHDETHTIRFSFRRVGQSENDRQYWYDWLANAWTSRILYNVRQFYHTVVTGAREVHVVQYDGFLRRTGAGTDFDGTAIATRVLLPWRAVPAQQSERLPNVVRWLGGLFHVDTNAAVTVDYRIADTPDQFDGAGFTAAEGTIPATPGAERGFVGFGNTLARWIQVRVRTASGAVQLHVPVLLFYQPIPGRKAQ